MQSPGAQQPAVKAGMLVTQNVAAMHHAAGAGVQRRGATGFPAADRLGALPHAECFTGNNAPMNARITGTISCWRAADALCELCWLVAFTIHPRSQSPDTAGKAQLFLAKCCAIAAFNRLFATLGC